MTIFIELILSLFKGPWYFKLIWLIMLCLILYKIRETLSLGEASWTWRMGRRHYTVTEIHYSYNRESNPILYWLSVAAMVASIPASAAFAGLFCMILE